MSTKPARVEALFQSTFPAAFGALVVVREHDGERREITVRSVGARDGSLWAEVEATCVDADGGVVDARVEEVCLGEVQGVPRGGDRAHPRAGARR